MLSVFPRNQPQHPHCHGLWEETGQKLLAAGFFLCLQASCCLCAYLTVTSLPPWCHRPYQDLIHLTGGIYRSSCQPGPAAGWPRVSHVRKFLENRSKERASECCALVHSGFAFRLLAGSLHPGANSSRPGTGQPPGSMRGVLQPPLWPRAWPGVQALPSHALSPNEGNFRG